MPGPASPLPAQGGKPQSTGSSSSLGPIPRVSAHPARSGTVLREEGAISPPSMPSSSLSTAPHPTSQAAPNRPCLITCHLRQREREKQKEPERQGSRERQRQSREAPGSRWGGLPGCVEASSHRVGSFLSFLPPGKQSFCKLTSIAEFLIHWHRAAARL